MIDAGVRNPDSAAVNPDGCGEDCTAPRPGPSGAGGGSTEITLGLLCAIETDSAVTQRSLAGRLGVALGLANIYLKRCVNKGLIKVRQAPARRYGYYLTPRGFTEKTQLTADYLSASFGFFRKTRAQITGIYDDCRRDGQVRLVLAGGGDLAEVAVIAAMEAEVTLLAILDRDTTTNRMVGVPVVRSLDALGAFDAVLVTDIRAPQQTYDRLAETLADGRILTPAILGVTRPARRTGSVAD